MASSKPAGPLASWAGQPKEKRFNHAVKRVEKGDAIATVAREMNVSRSALYERLGKLRSKKDDDATRVAAAATGSPDEARSRRAGPMLSFEEFDQRYFGGLVCPDCNVHHETPEFHREISEAIQGPNKRNVVTVPPYHSKSTLATIKHTIYDLIKDPNFRIIVVSASQAFAIVFMHSIQEWLRNPDLYSNCEGNLIDDYGPFDGPGSRFSQTSLYISTRNTSEKDPSVLCIGVGNQIYGRRAHRIVFDDIATLDNQRNPEQVTKQLEWIDKMALSRLGRSGQAVFVGTRISAGDIYSYLERREGYNLIKYPCILDEDAKTTLWPDHYPYEAAVIRRSEMRPEDWQLVYQNVDTPGAGSSFPAEVLEECLDTDRVLGQIDPKWKLFVGLDPAGGGKQSGFTALVLLGHDRDNQKLHLVDMVNARSMKAYTLKDQILDWCSTYNVAELRVESNGLQGQLVQYNNELIIPLTQRGVRVVPHFTHSNKWDANFGVEAIAPWFYNRQISIPWGSTDTQHRVRVLMDQFIGFPMAERSDLVMAFWFAWLGVKESAARQPGPMYGNRRMPRYVHNRRRVADPKTGQLWHPNDPNMPDFGRSDVNRPTAKVKLVNVGGSITVW